ncbi:MAG: GumC family protein, partial [Polyangiaceae bacterium]
MRPSEPKSGTPKPSGGWSADAATVLKALRRSWPLIVACVILCGGAALMRSKAQPPVFEASTLVEITPQPVQPLGDKGGSSLDMGAGLYWDAQEYYQTQYQIILSNQVLGAVARDLSLASDLDFLGLKTPPSAPIDIETVTATLRARTTIDPIKNSRLFHVKVEDTDPKRARRLSDAIATAFIDQNLQTAINSSSEAVTWITSQLDHIKGDLDRNENALYEFKRKNDLPSASINDASNVLRMEMQQYDTALTQTRTRKQGLIARETELVKVTQENPDDVPSSELLSNTYLQQLRAQYQQLIKDRAALVGEGKGESHPLLKSLNARLEQTKTQLLAEVRNIRSAVETDLAVIEHQEAGELALFEDSRRRAVELNMKEIEYHRLDRTREENEKLFELLTNKMKEADLTRMMRVNNIRIVDFAEDPGGPVRPRIAADVGIGVLSGLILGVALMWARELLD